MVGSNVTATSNAHILSGYTAYGKNGVKYTGSDKGYNNGYSAGRTQGQNDVKNNPNSYGLYTKSQYDTNYNNGRTQGRNDVKNNPNSYGLYSKSQYDSNWNNGYNSGVSAKTSKISSGHVTTGNSVYLGWQPNIVLVKRDGDRLPAGLYSSIGVNINYMEGPSQSHQDNVIWTNGDSFGFSNLSSYNNNKYCYYVAARIV